MKNKKLIAILTLLCFMFTLMPVAALATTIENCSDNCEHIAAIGTTHYDTLIDAVNAATDGQTIKLLKDYTVATAKKTSYILPDNGTLDLNNCDLIIPSEKAYFLGNNIKICNGTITLPDNEISYALLIKGTTRAIVENVTINGGGINVMAGAEVILKNNTVLIGNATRYYAVYAASGAKVIIESGSYQGGTKKNNEKDLYEVDTDGIIVYGGTFANSINNKYLADGYWVKKNDNDIYDVVSDVKGKADYYTTLQAAVDAGETNVTLMKDRTENFIIPKDIIDGIQASEQDVEFILNLDTFTLDGTISFADGVFTVSENHDTNKDPDDIHGVKVIVNGTSTENDITLAAPVLDHHVFQGWCSSNTGTSNSEQIIVNGGWKAESGNTYHTHWAHSNYVHLPSTALHLTFTMPYGGSIPSKQEVTFQPAIDDNEHKIIAVDQGDYFDVTYEDLTVTLTPKADVVSKLDADNYTDVIHVTLEDGSVHSITANLEVTKMDSVITPSASGSAEEDVYVYAEGEKIIFTAKVTKALKSSRAAAQDKVIFYCDGIQLDDAVIVEYDTTVFSQQGTATLEVVAGTDILVGTHTITAEYGGSVNLNESESDAISVTVYAVSEDGSITVGGVTVAPSESDGTTTVIPDANGDVTIGSGSSITTGGDDAVVIPDNVEATVPVDKLEEITVADGTIVLPEESTVTVNDNSFTVESGMVIVNADGSVTIPVGTELTQNGVTQSYPYGGTIAADGTVTVNKAPSSNTSSGGFSGSYNYPVSAPTTYNGSVSLSDSNAVAGETVTITVNPDNGYGLDELIVTDANGNVIPVTSLGGGKYSFVMPAGKVSISTEFAPTITLTIGSKIANVFGKTVTNDVAPIIVDGRTMLPIRFVAEALGATVAWNADTQMVTIIKDGVNVQIIIGADYAYINGEKVSLDAPAFIENGRTYLPVRFVSEALGADVNWDAATRQVVILK